MSRHHKGKVIICLHGGGWTSGTPYNPNFEGIESFNDKGYEVYAPTYPLVSDDPDKPYTPFPGVLWYIQKEINKFRDYKEVTLLGTSAGATYAAMTAIHYSSYEQHRTPDKLALLYGYYDFTDTVGLSPEVVRRFNLLMPTQDYGYRHRVSPVTNASALDENGVDVTIFHGNKDKVIDPIQSEWLSDKLDNVTFVRYDGGHGTKVVDLYAPFI